MTRTIELTREPRLAGLFAKAVATSAGRGGALPDLEVVRPDVKVDPAALAAYDRVCGFPLRDELPSTYLHVLTFPLQVALFADRSYPYPLTGSVHLSNRIVQHRPVGVREPLRLSVRATDATPHRRGATVDIKGQVHAGEELVWEGSSTYLYRGQKAEGEVPPKADEPEAVDGTGALWRLPGDLGRRYAAVSGDVNPIHMSRLGAKALGFPTTIVHGMWSAARMLAAVENRVPPAYVFDIAFGKPVLLPSTVKFVAHDGPDGVWQLALRNAKKGTVLARASVGPAGAGSIS